MLRLSSEAESEILYKTVFYSASVNTALHKYIISLELLISQSWFCAVKCDGSVKLFVGLLYSRSTYTVLVK